MDIEVLGKKLDTYRNKRGRIVNARLPPKTVKIAR